MADAYKIEVHKREEMGSRNVRNLRKEGKIPGVYYSYDSSNLLFQISESEIRNAINSKANIFSVNVGGKDQNVIFKSVQYHPVTDNIIHIDLYGVDMTKIIAIKIPGEKNAFTVEEISDVCKKLNIFCIKQKNIISAQNYLLNNIIPERILITGSLYLVGKARRLFV